MKTLFIDVMLKGRFVATLRTGIARLFLWI